MGDIVGLIYFHIGCTASKLPVHVEIPTAKQEKYFAKVYWIKK